MGDQTQKAEPSGTGIPDKQGRSKLKALKGKRPRESVLAGAGEIRHARSNTPEQSQDLREGVVGCVYMHAGSIPAEEDPGAEDKTNGKRGSRNPIRAIRGGAEL